MAHEHHHHHGGGQLKSLNATYYIAIALNLGFVVVEALMGIFYNSLGLLSDAGHKLIDVFSLLIALVAFKLTASRPRDRFTYGFRKTSVLISLVNAVILLVAVCVIVWESIEKFGDPSEVNGAAISWTAGIGIVVSGISALLLMHHQKRDINTRGAFLHMATDALVSVGVVASGLVISATGWDALDPVVSLVIAAIILFNTCKLLWEGFRMSIDAVPDSVDCGAVKKLVSEYRGVASMEELHIWPVSITETALTVHLGLTGDVPQQEVVEGLHRELKAMGIDIVTIECRTL